MNFELNNNNCKEYTTEELESKLNYLMNEEATIEDDIKKLHNLCAKGKKIDGVITNEYREQVKKEVEAKTEFQSKWGKQCLTTFVIYSTLKTRLQNVPNNLNKSAFKLQSSKGNGFGNM
tara:strand:- start:258 stop:614 length:357 start_codon:yes stop_codon:yes gene_type:complete